MKSKPFTQHRTEEYFIDCKHLHTELCNNCPSNKACGLILGNVK